VNLPEMLASDEKRLERVLPVGEFRKKASFRKEIPGIVRKKFLYNLSRSSYEK
jgi:hypothetical protein